jgi:hypothetical protein
MKTTRGQIVLTPTESKKIIAQAIVRTKKIQEALSNGIVVIHPSSTTYFILEHITGKKPEGVWLLGMICPRGTCLEGLAQNAFEDDNYQELTDPANFPFSYVFRKGKFETGHSLESILSEMGSGDVYIKGMNAFDAHGYVASLIGSLAGGTIGKVLKHQKTNGFETIFLAGIEKFIPSSLVSIAKETGRAKTTSALGSPCGLLPIKAKPFTEIDAFRVLTDTTAIPIAAGGVGGAEGSTMFVIKGEENKVEDSMSIVKAIKGVKLPLPILPNCQECHYPGCYFSGQR